MAIQDQTRKAFGHYASRAHARANAGNLGMVGSSLNPLLMKRGDDLELPGYVTPPIADERLKKQADDLESPGYVTPPVVDDLSLTDDQLAGITADIDAAVGRYKKHSVNGPKLSDSVWADVSMGDLSPQPVIDYQIDMDYDGYINTAEDYARLVKKDYVASSDDHVVSPKAEDMSFTDALVGQDNDNLHIDVSGHGSPDVIIARPDVAKELGSTVVNGFGDVAKVVSSDDLSISDDIGIGYDYDGDSFPDEKGYGRLARRGYLARNMTNNYVQPPKYDDYVPPKYDDYVQPPKADDYVQPPTASDAFDASQFEMANDEATNSIDEVPMGIDEGQFDIGSSKGLQQ